MCSKLELKVGQQLLHVKSGGIYLITDIVKFKVFNWWVTTVWYHDSSKLEQPTYVRLLSQVQKKFLFR
jgi:hypothetical protein